VDMSNSNLTRADMNYSVMIRGNFYAAKMTGMNLNHASLNEAMLIEADLWISHINYANFTAADLKFTEFAGANHVGAIFTNTYWFQTMWIDSYRYDTNQG
ncbi:MAG: pentapeptide repeat-containing protein, partial [Candidatus Thermoplasmatota archaeon]|nr:pentapeptide repeat-containing protein [Candidatus Thermoplasmatota archaeon]